MANSNSVSDSPRDWNAQRARLSKFGQEHLLQFLGELTPEQEKDLYEELSELSLPDAQRRFKESQLAFSAESAEKKDERMKPLDCGICGSTTEDTETILSWRRRGLEKISRGEVAVLLLAGEPSEKLLLVTQVTRTLLIPLTSHFSLPFSHPSTHTHVRGVYFPFYLLISFASPFPTPTLPYARWPRNQVGSLIP